MTERILDSIDDIMDYFDFETVEKTMKMLEWQWATIDNKVPNKYQLKRHARKLLKRAIEMKSSLRTGGFSVIYEKHKNGDISLGLSFEVAQWREYVHEAKTDTEYKQYKNKYYNEQFYPTKTC